MTSNRIIGRRELIRSGVGLGLTAATASTALGDSRGVEALDLTSPSGTLKNYVKLLGTLNESTVYVAFEGILWGIRPDQTPLELCGFKGIARMDWAPQPDGSYYRKSFDVGYFSNLETGEPLDSMVNPLTGRTVRPFHYKYGGNESLFSVNGIHGISADGDVKDAEPFDLDWRTMGNQIWLNEVRSGEYPSPLSSEQWPRESPGEVLQYAGETSHVSTIDQMADSASSQADYSLFWSSVLSWEPWLEMGSTPGFTMWRGVGAKLRRYQDAGEDMLNFVAKEQDNYFDAGDPWSGVINSYNRFKEMRRPANGS